jgi:hypothetical protein
MTEQRQLEELQRLVRDRVGAEDIGLTIEEWDRVARAECGSGKALAKVIAEQKEEEEEARMHLNHLMECVRANDTNNFSLEDWRRLALAGSIYWQ